MSGQERVAWVGGAEDGRVLLRGPAGEEACASLAAVAAFLQRHPDPHGGFAAGAAALGIALHALRSGDAPWRTVLAEAGVLLAGLPVAPVLARLRACADRHGDLLGPREQAARLLLEARRLVRTWGEAVGRAAAAAAPAVPASGQLLLAWPGGPSCDLGPGLLLGAVAGSRRAGRSDPVVVAGPPGLARECVAGLAAVGVVAHALDAAAARAVAQSGPLAGVLVRCIGEGAVAEPESAALAGLALQRRLPVLAVGVRERVRASGEILPATARRFVADLAPAAWEAG